MTFSEALEGVLRAGKDMRGFPSPEHPPEVKGAQPSLPRMVHGPCFKRPLEGLLDSDYCCLGIGENLLWWQKSWNQVCGASCLLFGGWGWGLAFSGGEIKAQELRCFFKIFFPNG